MRYISTRGHASRTPDSSGRTFTEILLGGLAPDGGLYLPESYPLVSPAQLEQWRRLSYADLAYAVLSSFIDDIPPADLEPLIRRPTPRVYCNGRGGTEASEITPLRWLEPPDPARGEGGLAILELSNGPTLAFKDMAMQLLGNLFEYVLAKRGERSTSSAPPRATPVHRPNMRCAANKVCGSSCSRHTSG
jgi:threonine synthase